MTIPSPSHAPDEVTLALRRLLVPAPDGFVAAVLAQAAPDAYVTVGGPVGRLYVAFSPRGVTRVIPVDVAGAAAEFERAYETDTGRPVRPGGHPPDGLLDALAGGGIAGLALDLSGLTAFERAVLMKAAEIPRGQVRPYSWVAAQIGRPRAVRAVGSALGRNPVPVVVACHRVTRSDGTLGQYVFGPGLKKALLAGEGLDVDEAERLARARTHYLGDPATGLFCYPSCGRIRAADPGLRVPLSDERAARSGGFEPCPACQPALLSA